MDDQKQPGWMLLIYLGKLVTDDFILIKIIQAVFINIALFSFFKRETRYVFLCVLIYALISYLVINFNVYRQSFALGFALYGYSYLRQKKYLKYYLFVFLAWLFHSTAVILIVFPLFHFLKFNKWTIIAFVALFAGIIIYLSNADLTNTVLTIIDKGYLGEDLSSLGLTYMSSERQGVHETFSVFSLRRLIIVFVVGYYIFHKKDLFIGSFGVIYLIIGILTGFMQGLWRFRLYIDPFYYILLASVIAEFPQKHFKQKLLVYIISLVLLLYLPIRDYVTPLDGTKWRGIDQYYPYHSIFDPEINYEQRQYFENL